MSYQDDFLEELIGSYRPIEGPLQNFLGGRVSQALSSGKKLDDPIDLGMFKRFSNRLGGMGGMDAQRQQADWISGLSTVREAQNALVSSMTPTLLAMGAGKERDFGVGYESTVSQGVVGILEGLPGYRPEKGNFVGYAGMQALNANTQDYRTMHPEKQVRVPMLSIPDHDVMSYEYRDNKPWIQVKGQSEMKPMSDFMTYRDMTPQEVKSAGYEFHTGEYMPNGRPTSGYMGEVGEDPYGSNDIQSVDALQRDVEKYGSKGNVSTVGYIDELGSYDQVDAQPRSLEVPTGYTGPFKNYNPTNINRLAQKAEALRFEELPGVTGRQISGWYRQEITRLGEKGFEGHPPYPTVTTPEGGKPKLALGWDKEQRATWFGAAPEEKFVAPTEPADSTIGPRMQAARHNAERLASIEGGVGQMVDTGGGTAALAAGQGTAMNNTGRLTSFTKARGLYGQDTPQAEAAHASTRNAVYGSHPVQQASSAPAQRDAVQAARSRYDIEMGDPEGFRQTAAAKAGSIVDSYNQLSENMDDYFEPDSGSTPNQPTAARNSYGILSEREFYEQRRTIESMSEPGPLQGPMPGRQRRTTASPTLGPIHGPEQAPVSPPVDVSQPPPQTVFPSPPPNFEGDPQDQQNVGSASGGMGAAASFRPNRTSNRAPTPPPTTAEQALRDRTNTYAIENLKEQGVSGASFAPASGGYRMMNSQSGSVALEPYQVNMGIGAGQTAIGRSLAQGNLPEDPADMIATVTKRVSAEVNKIFDKIIKDGGSNVDQQAARDMKNIASKVSKQILDSASEGALTVAQKSTVKELAFGRSVDLGTDQKRAEEYLAGNPQMARTVESMGGLEKLQQGPSTVLGDGDGGGATFGSSYGGRGGSGGMGGGMWGSAMGRGMYAAYIAKRMWGMTAAPMMQKSEEYSKYLGQFDTLAASEGQDLDGADVSHSARSAAAQRYWQKGAYEQFGGFTDAMYSMTGGSTAPARAAAGLGLAGGLAMTGGVLQGTAAMMSAAGATGMAAATGAAAPILIGAGAIAGVGTVGMEAYNAIAQPETPLSWGGIASGAAKSWALIQAEHQFARDARDGSADLSQGMDEALGSYMTSQQRATVYGDQGREFTNELMGMTDTVMGQTGEDENSAIGALSKWSRLMPGKLQGAEGRIEEMTSRAKKAGLTFGEYTQQVSSLASQVGIMPKTQEYMAFEANYGSMGLQGQTAMQGQIETYGAVAGMIRPYFGSTMEAASFARQNDLSYTSGRIMQQYGSLLQEFGVDMDEIVSYEAPTGEGTPGEIGGGKPITYKDLLARRAKETDPRQASVDVSVASLFMRSGASGDTAMSMAGALGISSSNQASAFSGFYGIEEQLFGKPSTERAYQLGGYSQMQSSSQSGVIAQMAPFMARAGFEDPMGALSTGGYSDQSMLNLSKAYGGDMKAWSYMSWQDGGSDAANMAGRFFNQGNSPIQQSSGSDFMGMIRGQAMMWQNPIAMSALQGVNPSMDAASQLGQMLGSSDMTMMQAFAEGGTTGMTQLHNQRQYQYQAAGAGNQLAQLQLRQDYLWGAGSWDNPEAGSAWGLQDQQQAIQWSSTLYGFDSQKRRMDTNNQFSRQQEGLSKDRMELTHDYTNWSSGFNKQTSMTQRGWAREDWQYQDQMTSLQFGWAMEDADESIRMSSGRERRQLVEQKERSVTKHNLEGGQTDKTRERQEELWAREDERYERQQEYTEEMQGIEEEQHELNVERRETLFDMDRDDLNRRISDTKRLHQIQEAMQKSQREYTADQMELQRQAIGISAAAAQESMEYQETLTEIATLYAETAGAAQNIAQYEPEKAFEALSSLAERLSEVDQESVDAQRSLIEEVGSADIESAEAVRLTLQEMSAVSIPPVEAVSKLLLTTDEINKLNVDTLTLAMAETRSINKPGLLAFIQALKAAQDINTAKLIRAASALNMLD